MNHEALIPTLGVVTDVRVDTPDVKTFRVNALGGGKQPYDAVAEVSPEIYA